MFSLVYLQYSYTFSIRIPFNQ
ncbi:hypothetical protein HID58_060454 [Brassica napus]|uniref:Uncharacterized protein n=1 Tax=Brassica napus TaxID=3708 RepID=A0ABQ7XQ80_BRANA|nr:hypothetical protein HID58_086297 [Brassica napus]KAH0884358.1 hypothetical protein HID58_060454 [Brassica napus]